MVLLRLMTTLLLMVTAVSAFGAGKAGDVNSSAGKSADLYIYGAVARPLADLLVSEFNSVHPGIKVDFVTMSGPEVFSRHMQDIAKGYVSADILWSGESALQASLVKSGYALQYRSPVADGIYPWANLGDFAYATAVEPVVMAYNRKLISPDELPATHKAMIKDFRKDKFKGGVGVVDPDKSEQSFRFLTVDLAFAFDFWSLAKTFGATGIQKFADYQTLLNRLVSGEILFGYNLPLSTVLSRAKPDADIGWYYPADYALAPAQTVLISKNATHKDAARLWVDFLLSAPAQQIVSRQENLFPVRGDVAGGEMVNIAGKLPPALVVRPVGTGAEVSRYNDQGLRKGFLLRWQQLLQTKK